MELIDNKSKLLGDDLSKKQSNRKFEYNERLKQYKEEREKLLEGK